jgi:hypothetical protein
MNAARFSGLFERGPQKIVNSFVVPGNRLAANADVGPWKIIERHWKLRR